MTTAPRPLDEQRWERAVRDAQIVAGWLAGASASSLATIHEVSETRVRQVIQARPGLKQERASRLVARRKQQSKQVLAWSARNPGVPVEQAAAELGLEVRVVRSLLGPRASLHRPRTVNRRGPSIDDEQLLQALREFVQASPYDDRVAAYQQLAKARGWPSSTTVVNRLGGWRAALAAAGHASAPLRRRPPRYSDDQLIAWLRRYLAECEPPWSFRQFAKWVDGQDQAPSSSEFRRRFGNWETMLSKAAKRKTRR